jgi:hypothetical protein
MVVAGLTLVVDTQNMSSGRQPFDTLGFLPTNQFDDDAADDRDGSYEDGGRISHGPLHSTKKTESIGHLSEPVVNSKTQTYGKNVLPHHFSALFGVETQRNTHCGDSTT